MKKRMTALLLAMSLAAVSLAGCGSTGKDSGDSKKKADDDVYHVGVIQLVEHEALDAATEGFQDALKEKLGDKVVFDVQNAQGEETNCATICTKFVNDDVDLIMANATQALTSAATATPDIPIVGTSVTDFVTTVPVVDRKSVV